MQCRSSLRQATGRQHKGGDGVGANTNKHTHTRPPALELDKGAEFVELAAGEAVAQAGIEVVRRHLPLL
jgi:hypothetical protein